MQIYINRKSGHIYCSVVDNLLTCVVLMYYAMTNDRWLVDDRGCMVVAPHVWKIVITAAVTTQHHQLSWMAFCFASIKLYIVSPTKIWRYPMSHGNMVNGTFWSASKLNFLTFTRKCYPTPQIFNR